MARIFIEGFESGDLKLWPESSNATVLTTPPSGFSGSYYLRLTGTPHYVARSLPEKGELYVAMKVRRGANSDFYTRGLIGFYNGNTKIGSIEVYTNGALLVNRGDTTITTSSTLLALNTTYRLEIYFKPSNTGGRWIVKIDGITDIDFTGDTTDGPTTINRLMLGRQETGYNADIYFDDLVVDDAEFPGNTKIQGLVPTGGGNSTQWTSSAGANYECVDEKPASEADYVLTNQVDQLDLYPAGDLVGSIESLKCVQIQTLTIKQGAATPQNLQLALRTNNSNYFSGDKAVPTAPTTLFNIWKENPATSASWETSEVNDMEIGVKAVA